MLARSLHLLKEPAATLVKSKNIFGEVAATISHELNQPLAAMTNYIGGCIRRLESDKYRPEDLLGPLQVYYRQANRAGELIDRMKNFIRYGTLQYSTANINQLIQEIIILNQNKLAKTKVNIQLKLCQSMPDFSLDEIQIGQVLQNLLNNALEAMQIANTTNPELTITTMRTDINTICVEVFDNGPGLAKGLCEKSLTPYFTTKESGMGLGLAICKAIIEAHGWRFMVDYTTKQNGARFHFYLPVISAEQTANLSPSKWLG